MKKVVLAVSFVFISFMLIACSDKESLKQVDSKILEQYPYFDELEENYNGKVFDISTSDCKCIVFYRMGIDPDSVKLHQTNAEYTIQFTKNKDNTKDDIYVYRLKLDPSCGTENQNCILKCSDGNTEYPFETVFLSKD